MRTIEFSEKDLPLRNDVSALGALIGEMLREQVSPDFFDHVETVRKAAIKRRQGTKNAGDELETTLAGLETKAAEQLVRAFAAYFRVVNLAEKVHRIRRRRQSLRGTATPQIGSLRAVIGELKAAGNSFDEVWQAIAQLLIQPVFTAHPTESTRRTILEKEQDIVRRLVERLNPELTPPEERLIMARIRAAITSGWQTQLHPDERPTVAAEMEHVLFYVTDVLYRIVPPFYQQLHDALAEHYPEAKGDLPMPVLLRFGSWVGGDMDGNPNVDARSIRATLAEHRRLIVERYLPEVRQLSRYLSQTTTEVAVSKAVKHRVDTYRILLPEIAQKIPARHSSMPYRCLLTLMTARLHGTLQGQDGGYANGSEFVSDLQLIHDSLEQHKGEQAGLYLLRRTQLRARAFGFHLASLDVRQDSAVHRQVLGLMLDDPQWSRRAAITRTERLTELLHTGALPDFEHNETIETTLEVFRAISEGQRDYGRNAIGPYIISMTQDVDDVLTPLLLARCAGLIERDQQQSGRVPLDVAPLLETVDDLQAGARILQQLFSNPVYREHLAGRGQRQIIMIGYSDSNKDSGIAASRWALQQAQRNLVAVAENHSVEVVFFHGRGGTISRGGGNLREGILGAPAGSVSSYLRVTEQGETINQKYGVRSIALRNLELTTGATLQRSLGSREVTVNKSWHEVMDFIAQISRETFRGLVYETPTFISYFRQATPIDVIERLAIGSRPASRRSQQGIENLRAIPWVFSWAQTRTGLPGTFGMGTALSAAVEKFGIDTLHEMVERWTFFRALINDVEMVLAKSDLDISRRYAALADDDCRSIYDTIANEMNVVSRWVLELKGSKTLLDDQRTLQRSIELRNPYVDPMNLLQIDLLKRWRETEQQDNELLQALFSTVNGISQGIQNTG